MSLRGIVRARCFFFPSHTRLTPCFKLFVCLVPLVGCLFVCLFVSGFVSTEFQDMFETAATELKCNFTLPPHDTTVIGDNPGDW